ncbi:hypothetical protein BD309DRAFT_953302 [Dichomitus squalens]|nr:hypothetical protein BD309DRAFT_953302 [Dichomitus squalens]
MNASSDPIQSWTPTLVAEKLDQAFFPAGCRLEMACVALIIYEYILTFPAEHRVIWKRRLTIPTVLFLLNRYCLMLFGLSIALWAFVVWEDDSVCRFPNVSQQLFGTLLDATQAVFMALRIHTINNRKWFWTALILLLGLSPVPPNVIEMFPSRPMALPWPLTGCAETIYSKGNLNNPVWTRVVISVQLCSYVANFVVVAITWYRTAGIAIAARKARLRTSLVSLILRDGTTYFIATLIVDSVLMYYVLTRQVSLGLVAIIISSILMSRFILNLRTLDQSPVLTTISAGTQIASSLRFAQDPFDNLGEPLDVDDEDHKGLDDEQGEDDEESLMTEGWGDSRSLSEYHAVNRSDSLDFSHDPITKRLDHE